MKTTLKFSIVLLLLAVAAMQVQAQNLLLPKYEFTVNGFGGLSTLNYDVNSKFTNYPDFGNVTDLKLGLGGGLGFGFNYFFNDNVAFVTGLEAALYRATFSTQYIRILYGNAGSTLANFKESQNYLALQLPLMVQFTVPLDPLGIRHFYAGIGGKLGYGLLGNYKQSAAPLQLPAFEVKETLTFAPFNAMGSVETGIRWKLSETMGLYTGIYADYGFLNIIPDKVNEALYSYKPDKNNSILQAVCSEESKQQRYTNEVNTIAAGVKIKLAFGGKKKVIAPVVELPPAPAPKPEPKPVPVVKEIPQEIKQSMMKLSHTLFAFDKWNLTNEAIVELDKVVKWLKDNPEIKVQIEGHTDSYGTPEYNQRLSEDRARSVYNYFVDHGVQASRLSYRGYGLTRPVADNATAEGRQLNRRAELQIIQ